MEESDLSAGRVVRSGLVFSWWIAFFSVCARLVSILRIWGMVVRLS